MHYKAQSLVAHWGQDQYHYMMGQDILICIPCLIGGMLQDIDDIFFLQLVFKTKRGNYGFKNQAVFRWNYCRKCKIIIAFDIPFVLLYIGLSKHGYSAGIYTNE